MSDQFDPRRYTDPSNIHSSQTTGHSYFAGTPPEYQPTNLPGQMISISPQVGVPLSNMGSVTATQSPTLFGQWPIMPLAGATMVTTRPRRFPLGRLPLCDRRVLVALQRRRRATQRVSLKTYGHWSMDRT